MISSWFGHFFALGREQEYTPYPPMILYARRMVRRGQSYAVDSKHFHNNGGLHRTSGDAPLKHMALGREQEYTPYPPMILYARRMVRRGQSYAVDSK
jgi:hypothetical protein